MTDLRYPIGPFRYDGPLDEATRRALIDEAARLPPQLRAAVYDLSPRQLDTPYRPGGWTVRQVVHHVPDSHANLYVRCKLALTEDVPVIRPYDERRWAELPDVGAVSLEAPLALLAGVHACWVGLLRTLGPDDFRRTYRHPEHDHDLSIDETLAQYVWHGRHHVAHITALRARKGW